jgi:hypothetical protein
MGQDELKVWGENRQRPFGPGKAFGVGERLHGRLYLLV